MGIVFCVVLTALSGGSTPFGSSQDAAQAKVEAPPPGVREQFGLSNHYQKYLAIGPLPIVASARVSDFAFLEAAYLIENMIGQRSDLLEAMARGKTRFAIMSSDEWTTRIPEHSDLRPRQYWDRRARGLGATPDRPAVSCGEENLLGYPGDPYHSENVLIHEFAHAIHQMGLSRIDPTFDGRLLKAYQGAIAKGLWEGKYAAKDHHEYWAEGVQSWFDTNRENDHDHNHVNTRAELIAYDPSLAGLVEEVFSDGAWRYTKPSQRKARGHLAGYDPASARTFRWPQKLTEDYEKHLREQEQFKRRPKEAELDWRHRIGAAGDTGSQLHLGWCYREGVGVAQSDRDAVKWYRLAAEANDPAGQDSLGWMLKQGRGIERDDAAAVLWFRRSADAGHAQGMFNLALMTIEGRGCDRDETMALAWFQLSADRGNEWAAKRRDALTKELDSDRVKRASEFVAGWRPTESP